MKAGIATTEFWMTLLGSIGGPTVVLTMISDQMDPTSMAYVIIASVAAAASVIWKYISSRQAVKTTVVK